MPQRAGTKRPAQTTAPDDARAECPFTVRLVDGAGGGSGNTGGGPGGRSGSASSGGPDGHADVNGNKNPKKRRKKDGDDDGGGAATPASGSLRRVLHQAAPFSPRGSFPTHSTMDVHYAVEPARAWSEMTRYNSFVLNGAKYFCEGFVYVANETSLERQRAAAQVAVQTAQTAAAAAPVAAAPAASPADGGRPPSTHSSTSDDAGRRGDEDWVARILEIRASDEHHVYARVFWMYWPDELPPHTVLDGLTNRKKKIPAGRQPYHGSSELVASNHMDIINVVSVTSMASVNHLIEDRDDDIQSALYWRQALDVRTMELSAIETACACGMPANPDKMLVGCGKPTCGKWIHEECLKHYALMRVVERLGRYKPHVTTPATKKLTHRKPPSRNGDDDSDDDEGGSYVKRPLSPNETGGAVSARHSIDVKSAREDEKHSKDAKDKEGDESDEPVSAQRRRRNGAAASNSANPGSATRGRRKKEDSEYEEEEEEDEVDDGDDDEEEDEYDDDDDDDTRRYRRRHTTRRGRQGAGLSSRANGGGLATPTRGRDGMSRWSGRTGGTPTKKQQAFHNPYPSLYAFASSTQMGPGRRKPPLPYHGLFAATLLLGPQPAQEEATGRGSSLTKVSKNATAAVDAVGDDAAGAGAGADAAATGAGSPASPTMIEIRDLRTGVSGGDRVWLEPAQCPLCGSAIR